MPRTRIAPRGSKRYVRRKKGKFTSKQVGVGRSLAADRRSKSKTIVRKGEGDRGDQKRRKTKRRRGKNADVAAVAAGALWDGVTRSV